MAERSERNLRMTIAYDGTAYQGWQAQPSAPTVQETIERGIRRLTGETLRITGAGRTDSGVHALGQVANFRTRCTIPADKVQLALQTHLPEDVIIRNVDEVPLEFHSAFSAVRKRYRYVIYNHRISNPFVRNYAWQYRGSLDVAAMQLAAQHLLGTHDFRCFETHYPNKASSVRTIMEARVGRHSTWPIWGQPQSLHCQPNPDENFLWFEVVADGFLYNMVRSIMGTLLEVGRGKWVPDDVGQVIRNQSRALAGQTAPACGLYLVSVDY